MMIPENRNELRIAQSQGSALVLTLLFIMLLTTMSTGMFIYASKQSQSADARYTQVAAGYISEAGLEAGATALGLSDISLDTNLNGEVDKGDFPYILPAPVTVGRKDATNDGKQGVGTYSYAIDYLEADNVEIEFSLTPQIPAPPFKFASSSENDRFNLIPFAACGIRIVQDHETINDYTLTKNNNVFLASGDLTFHWTSYNIMNPFADRDYRLYFGLTPFVLQTGDVTKESPEKDWLGNPIRLFPNDMRPYNTKSNILQDVHPDIAGSGVALGPSAESFYTFRKLDSNYSCYYLVDVHNLNTTTQPSAEVRFYYTESGMLNTQVLADASSWSSSDSHEYSLLNFVNEPGINWDFPDSTVFNGIADGTGSDHIKEFAFTVHGLPAGTTDGIHVTISRGFNLPVSLTYRMRTEYMKNKDADCWYPAWPCDGSTGLTHIQLDLMNHPNVLYDKELNSGLQSLARKQAIRVDQMYTVTSIGNVENARETRQLMFAPLSFLDYSRFTSDILTIATGASYSGKIYSQGDFTISDADPLNPDDRAYFYDDVVSSSLILNNELGEFPQDGRYYAMSPVRNLPIRDNLWDYYDSNRDLAWRINPVSGDAYVFLGPYNYNNSIANSVYGLELAENTGVGTDDIAIYHAPDGSLDQGEWLHPNSTVSVPFAPEPSSIDYAHYSAMGDRFNGLVIVEGNLHIWGKLRGRSLTFVVNGDIIIEREIVMGTTEPTQNEADEGLPVHLALISMPREGSGGDIILSRNCPRVMRVEAALVAIKGRWRIEDSDNVDGQTMDLDDSHQFFIYSGQTSTSEIDFWDSLQGAYPNDPITGSVLDYKVPFDINADGRISDANPTDPAYVELGGWDERDIRHQRVWHLTFVGPIITKQQGRAYAFGYRTSLPDGICGTTRLYKYDSTIRFNPPPFFPVPEDSIRRLEVSSAAIELPQ